MKKFFSLVLALVMALSLTTMAWGASTMPTADANGVINLTEDVTLSAQWVVTTDTTLNLNGHTISNTTAIWDNPTTDSWSLISVQGGTLTINGPGTVKALENDCYAMDLRGGNCVINGGEYIGNCSAVYVHTGILTVNSGSFAVQQQATSGNGYGEVLNCKDANYTAGTAKVIVNGGIFEGFNPTDAAEPAGDEQSYVASGYEAAEVGANGEFVVGQDIEVTNGEITGGTFADDVSAYVADGSRLVNGTVVSVPANTTDVVGGYQGQLTVKGATRQAITNFTKTPAVTPVDVNEDGLYNMPGDIMGSIEYYTFNLGGAVAQNYYQVNSVDDADLIVYVGDNTTPYMYLANEPAWGFNYIYGVASFSDFGSACGQFKYVDYDATKSYYTYAGEVFVLADDGEVNLKVGTKFVQANVITADGKWVAHTPVYTQNDKGVVTAISCAKCTDVGVIVANYAALPESVKTFKLGTLVPGSTTKYYYWVDTATVVTPTTPSTDKTVTSAETFDAGIAVYVGMSVLAATGSAVVIGKKKD